MKTGQQVEDDIYGMLASSMLPTLISGGVYKFGMRPKNSNLEDAVVKFVTGLSTQVQSGTVIVSIYVPDIDNGSGVLVRNITRCAELERLAGEWVQSLTTAASRYKFELAQTIYTEQEAEINQHFISTRLNYKYF